MKTVTCALVMINKYGDILGCHAYGKRTENGYDFPKGCYDKEDDDHLTTALRELREEAGIILSKSEPIIDAGIHNHNSRKNIHIFIYQVKHFPDIEKLNCTSYFTDRHGREVPEMDGYKIISKKDRGKYFYHGLQNKFELIDKLNGTEQ